MPIGGKIISVNGEAAADDRQGLNLQLASAARPLTLTVALPTKMLEPTRLPAPGAHDERRCSVLGAPQTHLQPGCTVFESRRNSLPMKVSTEAHL